MIRFFLSCIFILSFACSATHPTISSYQKIDMPYEGDVPNHILYHHLPSKGRFIDVEKKDNHLIKGELLAVYNQGIVINEISKELFDLNTIKPLHLKLIPQEDIDQVTIHNMIFLHNGAIYGSLSWIFYPFLTVFHGVLLVFTFPIWNGFFVYQLAIGYQLTYMKIEVDEDFDFQSLVPFSRFPHHLPKLLEEQIALKPQVRAPDFSDFKNQINPSEKSEESDQAKLTESTIYVPIAFGLGAKYAGNGFLVGIRYHLSNRWIFGTGFSIGSTIEKENRNQKDIINTNASSANASSINSSSTVPNKSLFNTSTFSVQLGYQINSRKSLMLSAGTDLMNPYYSTYRHLGIDYLYDFAKIYGAKVLVGLTVAQPGNQLELLFGSNLGFHYEF